MAKGLVYDYIMYRRRMIMGTKEKEREELLRLEEQY